VIGLKRFWADGMMLKADGMMLKGLGGRFSS